MEPVDKSIVVYFKWRRRTCCLVSDNVAFYLSTGRSNKYNFPGVFFPCKYEPTVDDDNDDDQIPKLLSRLYAPWSRGLVAECINASFDRNLPAYVRRYIEEIAGNFLMKFDGIENAAISAQLSNWANCDFDVRNSVGIGEIGHVAAKKLLASLHARLKGK